MSRFRLIHFGMVTAMLFAGLHGEEAHAMFGVGAQVGVSRYNTAFSGSAFEGFSSSANSAFAFRVYTELQLPGNLLGIEVGGTFQNRSYSVTASGTTQRLDYTEISGDALLRLYLPYLSLGIGGYAGAGLGMVDVTTNGSTAIKTLPDAGLNIADAGLLASARLEIPFAARILFTGDVRYLHGTNDLAKRTDGETKTRELQFLAGLGFRI